MPFLDRKFNLYQNTNPSWAIVCSCFPISYFTDEWVLQVYKCTASLHRHITITTLVNGEMFTVTRAAIKLWIKKLLSVIPCIQT